MKFKAPAMEKEFDRAPILLRIILSDFEQYTKVRFKKEIVITRILGKVDGDSGVHADFRAADIRDEFEGGYSFTSDESKEVCEYLNQKYYRNDGKPTVMHHSFVSPDGKTGPLHFHVQISALTKTYMPVK
jgi:hypothetical protein